VPAALAQLTKSHWLFSVAKQDSVAVRAREWLACPGFVRVRRKASHPIIAEQKISGRGNQ
jgi:hypothetical protein